MIPLGFPDLLSPVNVSGTSREWFIKIPELSFRASELRPKVLSLGTSRLMYMPPRLLAQSMGLETSETRLMGWPANTFFDSLALIRRNPSLVRNLDLLIMDLVPMQYHIGEHFPEDDALLFRRSTVGEKLAIRDPLERARAMLDLALPARSWRLSVAKWRDAIRLHGKSPQEQLAYYREQNPVVEIVVGFLDQGRDDPIAHVMNTQFPTARASAIQARALREIVDLLPDTCPIMLVRPPYRPDIEALIQDTEQYRRSNAEFRAFVDSIDHPRVHVLWMDDMAALGLEPSDYTDDGSHFNPGGMEKVARIIGEAGAEFLK